jgi:hypothetical protein
MVAQRKGEEYLNWKVFPRRGLLLNDHWAWTKGFTCGKFHNRFLLSVKKYSYFYFTNFYNLHRVCHYISVQLLFRIFYKRTF